MKSVPCMIGKHYKLKLRPNFFKTRIPKSALRTPKCSSDVLRLKYVTYGKLHGREVKVLDDYPSRSSDAYKVALVSESDSYWFVIDKKYLVPIIKLSSKCICSTRTLMCNGCQCGAFIFEKTQAKKEDDQGPTQPW